MVRAGTFYVCFPAQRASTRGFFCSRFSILLFGNTGISKYINTLFLLSAYICLSIGFICDLSVTVMIHGCVKIPPDGPNKHVYHHKVDGEVWGPVNLDLAQVIYYERFLVGTFIVILFC